MKLSIIVPVYNTAPWLGKCLDSLLSDNGAYEIIAVDDGSADNSREILKRYREKNPEHIRVITTPNGGLGHARNTGLDAAKGDFILFIDSDDYLSAHAVREMLEVLDDADADTDAVIFDFAHVDENGQELAYFRGTEKEEAFSFAEFPEQLFAPHNAVNKLWRRRLFTESGIRFTDRKWFEDLAAVPKLYLPAKKMLPMHRAWYRYYQRSGSIMLDTAQTARNLEMIDTVESVLDFYREHNADVRYGSELEYKFFYEELLASVTRVNRLDAKSPVQAQLRDDYLRRFPNWRSNPYVRSAPASLRILAEAVVHGNWHAVRTMTVLNNKRKGR